jgi:Na+/proline symporter
MHILDIATLVAYLVVITWIGVRVGKTVKTMRDFFMPRRFGKVFMMMNTFGTGTHADQAVGVASKSYTNGISGIWYQWAALFLSPFYWLIAPMMSRFRAITTGDIFALRFNRSVAVLFAFVGAFQLLVAIGTMLRGSGEVIAAGVGHEWVTTDIAIAAMTVVFVVYGVAGGLGAAIVTDFLQGILTIIFSFLLLPMIWTAAGGMDGMRAQIHKEEMFSLVAPSDIGMFYIVMISLATLVGIVTQPHTLGNCATGKSELEGRVGFMGGSLIKRVCTIPWALTGLAALAYFTAAGANIAPDKAFGAVAGEFLPKAMPGLLGLFLAALLASVMSTCDSLMIASSALFTQNIYKLWMPTEPDKHYIFVGRIASVFVVGAGVIFAYWLPGVVKGLEIFWHVAAMIGIAFWMGLYWRRATTAGAWAATLGGYAAWLLSTQGFFIKWAAGLPGADFMRYTVGAGEKMAIYMPWQIVFYLAFGVGAGVIVSLLTRPVAEEKLERFYALQRVPVKAGEVLEGTCMLPAGAVAPPRHNLLPIASLEIPAPSRISILGFIIGWVFVGLLILTVWLIMQI